MDFWEAQRRARKKTKLYLAVFIALTIGTAILLELCVRWYTQEQGGIPLIGLLFLGVTFGVAAFQYAMYKTYGGKYVAKSMGGKQIGSHSMNRKEQQLMHVVQEVALASSLPVPPVYLINANQINAFAAGLSPDSAAIGITKGALESFNRDELQGVIAHEFGHIYNGDMKISMRLAAMIMGFFFILYFAMRLYYMASLGGFRRSQERRGTNPLLLIAVLLIVAGSFTWFVGSILRASVSRQREYLADACSVQFTRNPDGLINALRKIAKEHYRDMPAQGMAYSHMYFDNHLGIQSLFATHPPIQKRIAAIEGKDYLPDE